MLAVPQGSNYTKKAFSLNSCWTEVKKKNQDFRNSKSFCVSSKNSFSHPLWRAGS